MVVDLAAETGGNVETTRPLEASRTPHNKLSLINKVDF